MRPAVRIFIAENGMMVEFLEGDKYIASENETDRGASAPLSFCPN